jgi:hypothetical protein
MAHMPKLYAVVFGMLALTVWAGDTTPSDSAPRREFRQRRAYPYVFEPIAYVENGTPEPMRFGWAPSDGTLRIPPPLPKPTPTPTPLPTPTPSPSASPTPTPAAESPSPTPKTEQSSPSMPTEELLPAYPPPGNAQPVPGEDALDVSKYPAEIVNIFKNPYNIPRSRRRFLEPVFEPALPPPPRQPASKATYQQN